MRRREGDLARPLLDISREDIEAYLAQLHLTPIRDATNDDPRFTRNRLRQQLMPAIDAFDPAARNLLARTADILSEEDRFIEAQLANLPHDIAANREAFARLPPALQRRVIRRLVPEAGFLEVERLRRGDAPKPSEAAATSSRPQVAVKTCVCDPATFRARDQVGHLDADLVRLPLVVGSRKPGDRMRALGLQQAKKLQDILVDAHVPRHLRDTLPLVSDGEEIVWIPGVTIAETKRVTPSTRRQLHLEIDRS
jgi:tRNA(Ile)-lysidine synthase